MKTYTTDTGIELLFPVVPKRSEDIQLGVGGMLWYKDTAFHLKPSYSISLPFYDSKDLSILGTCWRENGKLVCEGFDPAQLVESFVSTKNITYYSDYMKKGSVPGFGNWQGMYENPVSSFDSLARREGIEIAEGEFMNVVLKVN